jgi:hypothetical protein
MHICYLNVTPILQSSMYIFLNLDLSSVIAQYIKQFTGMISSLIGHTIGIKQFHHH